MTDGTINILDTHEPLQLLILDLPWVRDVENERGNTKIARGPLLLFENNCNKLISICNFTNCDEAHRDENKLPPETVRKCLGLDGLTQAKTLLTKMMQVCLYFSTSARIRLRSMQRFALYYSKF